MDYRVLDLCMFGEGGDAGGAAGAGSTQGTGVTAQDAAGRGRKRQENPLEAVQYGVQTDAPAARDAAAKGTQQQPQQDAESFDSLISDKGKYKQDFDARVQQIIKERFKKNAATEERMQKLAPVMAMLGQRYGLDADDPLSLDADELAKKLQADDSYLEAEAVERGMSKETLKQLKALEMQQKTRDMAERRERERQEIERHLNGLMQQGEQLKSVYPGFDFQKEMQNPDFMRLTSPGVGVPVRTAYEIVHKDEILGAGMQYAAQKSAEKVSAAIQSGSKRIAENGGSQAGGGVYKADPSNLALKDFEEIKRRVQAGAKIAF